MDDLSNVTEAGSAELLKKLLSHLTGVREQLDAYERRAAGLRKMIAGVVEMYPALEDLLPEDLDADDEPRPRGAEAVRRVLADNSENWFTVLAMAYQLNQRGWDPDSSKPANAIRTALERLVERKEAEKARSTDGAVIYRHVKPSPPTYDYGDEPF
ncbi:MAG TPA: hypothetical protein VM386_03065 [Acidimicrobiales bacterium]|jgi:hypothetical protein|nr:hypothetical protein [Acidimicrobiales bacterium]